MARTNTRVTLAERPVADIIPGKTFKTVTEPAPTEADLKDGQILVENLYLGLEPAMRGWLKDRRSYIPPVQIGATMRGVSVARVLSSRSPNAKEGDLVSCYGGWAEYAILSEAEFEPPATLPETGRATDLLSAFGLTSLTAYFGMTKIGLPKPGDLFVVSGAAGATGSVAGQIAKIHGARVVGIAGADDKCAWLKDELGFDEVLNYRDPDFKAKFHEATKGFIDVFWDNVGGDILDMALGRAKPHARFVMCGAISQYNLEEAPGPKNFNSVISMRIRLEGFIVLDYVQEFAEARRDLARWIEEGKLKRKETIVKGGLKAAEQALVDLYKGLNTGKLIVEVKSPVETARL